MILVRDVFELRFGRAREALALWQEGREILRRSTAAQSMRLLTDLAGPPYYTLVCESTYSSVGEMERAMQREAADAEWKAWYPRFVPLVERGHRELFTIVADG